MSTLPWVANVATVAVVLAATLWSNAQRPDAPIDQAALTAPVPAVSHAVPAVQPADMPPAAAQANPAAAANWPAQATALQRDGLQAVGYVNVARR